MNGSISSAEETQLQKWLDESPSNRELFEKVSSNQWQLEKLEEYQLFDDARAWSSLEQKLFEAKVIQFPVRKMMRYAATLLLPLLVIAGVSYYVLNDFSSSPISRIDETVKPGEPKATLVLADGSVVHLQDAMDKTSIEQENTQITAEDHSLTYTAIEEIASSEALIYNELVIPRGGRYQLKLPDGTQVWLNANSSLKFPVAFTDSTRQVFLQGEAFFDVAHNGKPFLVSAEDMNIRVLGTSFNVSAYADESYSAATLVEGSIKLSTPEMETEMVPDERATVLRSATSIEVETVNTSQYTSWVNGKIEFENERLEDVMRRLARLYDFQYSFQNEGAKSYHFSARIDNSQPISSILNMLELTTKVKFDFEENTIVIL